MGQAISTKNSPDSLDIIRDLRELQANGVIDINRDEDWVDKWISYSIVKEKMKEAAEHGGA